jgi:S1-C subfamily serine protease
MTAGLREAGVPCVRCAKEIMLGEATSVCRKCGAVHHSECWDSANGCNSYECSSEVGTRDCGTDAALKITPEELAAAQPLPTRSSSFASESGDSPPGKQKRRWNRVAIAAFVVALLGIPLFGLITGLIAMVVGCIGLAGHPHGRRGLGLGVAAIVIGLFDVVGWSAALFLTLGNPHAMVSLDQLTIDPSSLDELPERIARAMRANVVVQSGSALGRQGLGSGVILKISNGLAHIVTNRHMVDFDYSDNTRTAPKDLTTLKNIEVMTVGQEVVPAKVEWVAPHGVDLAIISAPILSEKAEEAHWDETATPHIGDQVFAVGNPHGLGWTHSAGDISQIRRQTHGDYNFRVLQTTAAINPGNSGGGLYDSEGRLIGINTMTGDKRLAEGLSFSIALPTLLDLVPDKLELPHKNPEPEPK